MIKFSDYIVESGLSGTSDTYKDWLIVYSRHIGKRDKNRESRANDQNITKKYLTERVKKAIKIIQKEHNGYYGNGEVYFITYLRGNVRCGFIVMIDTNPPRVINEKIPNTKATNFICLVKTILPCFDKTTNKPKAKDNDTVISLSENMAVCAYHDYIPNNIVEYIISLSENDGDFYTMNIDDKSLTFVSENNIIYEQRIDNGVYVVDIDNSIIY